MEILFVGDLSLEQKRKLYITWFWHTRKLRKEPYERWNKNKGELNA